MAKRQHKIKIFLSIVKIPCFCQKNSKNPEKLIVFQGFYSGQHFYPLNMAQRKGFEPLVLLWEHTRFRVVRVRPLRHLCITFSYCTILICFCQSFRQVFYQKSRQNSDYDTREHAERADKRQLHIQRRRFHDQRRKAGACNVAEHSPRHADRNDADPRERDPIQLVHHEKGGEAPRHVERKHEHGERPERGDRVFYEQEHDPLRKPEIDDDKQHKAVRQPHFHIRRERQKWRDQRFDDKDDARRGEHHA